MSDSDLGLAICKRLYQAGMEEGMILAWKESRASVKDAIRMGIQSAITRYDASDAAVEAIYQEWLKKNPNAGEK
jgi:hypothetical protein